MLETASRAKLRELITALAADQARLAALEAGRETAREQSWQAAGQLAEAKAELQQAGKDKRSQLAYAFVNDGELLADPEAGARERVAEAQRLVDKLAETEAALIAEIDDVQASLRQLRMHLHDAMAAIVIASPEYQAVLAEHVAAWRRLRTVKQMLRAIGTGLHGAAPQRLLNEPGRVEPLEIRIGFPVDAEPVERWAAALARLETDADAALPGAEDGPRGDVPEFAARRA